jgi:hypothetical protein
VRAMACFSRSCSGSSGGLADPLLGPRLSDGPASALGLIAVVGRWHGDGWQVLRIILTVVEVATTIACVAVGRSWTAAGRRGENEP